MAGLSEQEIASPAPELRHFESAEAVEAKLREGAERARRIREQRGASAPSATRTADFSNRVADLSAKGRAERIPVSEGDAPTLPPERRDLLVRMVPTRFKDVTFEAYKAETASQKSALAAARTWVDAACTESGKMLALVGRQGTGKSHLLYAALNELIARGVIAYARPWYKLADELRYGGKSPFTGADQEAHQVRQQLWGQRIVVIDEVRPTASTAFDDTELAKFACWAYDEKLAVLITTNVSPLETVMGAPAASRFVQVTVDGNDHRQNRPATQDRD